MIGALTLDQLRILAAVADAGSFSAAGRRLLRVQSAISQSVQGLESTLGVGLFDRSRKTPTLRVAGQALVGQARRILAEVEVLQIQALAIAGGLEPALAIAADSLFPSEPLLASLQGLRAAFPDLPVTLYTEPIAASERRARAGGGAGVAVRSRADVRRVSPRAAARAGGAVVSEQPGRRIARRARTAGG